jgi:glucosylceramidase
MDNTLDIDESTPLTGEKIEIPSSIWKKSFYQIKNNGMLFLIVGVIGIFIGTGTSEIFGEASSATSAATGKIPESLPPPPVEPVTTKIMYRPFCLTHGTPTARILQTSMGQPSQQWAHVPCYAQTESARVWSKNAKPSIHLNAYGAPDAIIRLNTSSIPFAHRKPILGFGAAFTEAAALNYGTLSEQGKKALMELVYGKSGLGYSIGRVPLNSCDFSIQSYSFDDVDGDFDLDHFDVQVTHDVQVGMVEMILRATTVFNTDWRSADGVDGHFQMYASPWSPPAWMKQPNWRDKKGAIHAENMTGSTEPSCLREGTQANSRYAKAWALYFSKFITACKYFKVKSKTTSPVHMHGSYLLVVGWLVGWLVASS